MGMPKWKRRRSEYILLINIPHPLIVKGAGDRMISINISILDAYQSSAQFYEAVQNPETPPSLDIWKRRNCIR